MLQFKIGPLKKGMTVNLPPARKSLAASGTPSSPLPDGQAYEPALVARFGNPATLSRKSW